MSNMSKEEFNRVVGINIQAVRKRASKNQDELAKELNVTTRTIQNYEKGKCVDFFVIKKLSEAFKCDVNDFLVGL